jgi:tol-pal system protein YbgF
MKKSGEMIVRHGWSKPFVIVCAALFMGTAAFADAPAPGDAQSTRALANRIAADEAGVSLLRQKIADAQDKAGVVQMADLFGESDADKAARLQKEQAQDQSIATLNQRVSDLEQTLRQLTGQMEELDHRVSEFNAKIDRMQKDFDYKICEAVAQQMSTSASAGDQPALPCSPGQNQMPASTGDVAPPANSAPVHLAPPPGVLGTLPQGAPLPQTSGDQPPPAGPAQTASIDTHAPFDAAMKLLRAAQYDEATAAFRNFADTYPKDDLAPQAIYWIGSIAYLRKDYPNAAHAFAEEIKKFPSNPRAPESMFKLGQSLIAMNQKKEGCTALAALEKTYPTASKTVQAQALTARKAAACR